MDGARGPRAPMVVGCLLAGAGLLLVDWKLTADTTVAALSWPLAIAGLGFGIALVVDDRGRARRSFRPSSRGWRRRR